MTIYILINAWPDNDFDEVSVISAYKSRKKALERVKVLKARDEYNYQYLQVISLRVR